MEGFRKLLSRNNGSPDRVAELLYQENYGHRREISELKSKLPPAGAVVLSGDDATRWEALKGYTPDELASALKERDTLKQQLEQTARRETIRKAGDIYGYDPDVLGDLPSLPPVEVTEQDGKEVAHVTTEGGKVLLDQYVTQHYPKFLPALQQAQRSQGVPFPQQPAGRSTPQSAAQRHISKTKYALPGQKSE